MLAFFITVGALFLIIFNQYSSKTYQKELERIAVPTAVYISDVIESKPGGANEREVSVFLSLVEKIINGQIWLVDINSEDITVGLGRAPVFFNELSPEAASIVDEVFAGNIVSSKNFNNLLNEPSMTLGVPVYSADGNEVIAALLLHSYVSLIDDTSQPVTIILLVSLLIALILVSIIVVFLSRRLSKPLHQMDLAIERLVAGDLYAQTQVAQDDEIGLLAAHIDILADRLRQASRESQKLEQMRKEFISNVSHELRTPVSAIRGSLEALNDGVVSDGEQIKQYYEHMIGESVQLQRMVNDLLELSRLQNAEYIIEKEVINLVDVINDIVRSAAPIAMQKDITIEYEKDIDSQPFSGDYGRLRQMIMIVLDNAIKFSENGQKVEIRFSKNEHEAVLSITDYGSGIQPENLPHIFDRFYKSTNSEGTGLGLSIAKQIATRHNVDIRVESQAGHTVFCFIFSVN